MVSQEHLSFTDTDQSLRYLEKFNQIFHRPIFFCKKGQIPLDVLWQSAINFGYFLMPFCWFISTHFLWSPPMNWTGNFDLKELLPHLSSHVGSSFSSSDFGSMSRSNFCGDQMMDSSSTVSYAPPMNYSTCNPYPPASGKGLEPHHSQVLPLEGKLFFNWSIRNGFIDQDLGPLSLRNVECDIVNQSNTCNS